MPFGVMNLFHRRRSLQMPPAVSSEDFFSCANNASAFCPGPSVADLALADVQPWKPEERLPKRGPRLSVQILWDKIHPGRLKTRALQSEARAVEAYHAWSSSASTRRSSPIRPTSMNLSTMSPLRPEPRYPQRPPAPPPFFYAKPIHMAQQETAEERMHGALGPLVPDDAHAAAKRRRAELSIAAGLKKLSTDTSSSSPSSAPNLVTESNALRRVLDRAENTASLLESVGECLLPSGFRSQAWVQGSQRSRGLAHNSPAVSATSSEIRSWLPAHYRSGSRLAEEPAIDAMFHLPRSSSLPNLKLSSSTNPEDAASVAVPINCDPRTGEQPGRDVPSSSSFALRRVSLEFSIDSSTSDAFEWDNIDGRSDCAISAMDTTEDNLDDSFWMSMLRAQDPGTSALGLTDLTHINRDTKPRLIPASIAGSSCASADTDSSEAMVFSMDETVWPRPPQRQAETVESSWPPAGKLRSNNKRRVQSITSQPSFGGQAPLTPPASSKTGKPPLLPTHTPPTSPPLSFTHKRTKF